MSKIKDIETYLISPNDALIPQVGLGGYKIGFTTERVPFEWKNLFWILLPIGGWLILLIFILLYIWSKISCYRVFIYEKGIFKQRTGFLSKDMIYRFDDISGISVARTKQYRRIYGFDKYTGTSVSIKIELKDGSIDKFYNDRYRNEYEVEGEYEFAGYMANALTNSWIDVSLKRVNEELKRQGYATFRSEKSIVSVGRGFIKSDSNYANGQFRYSFDNGYLYIYPGGEDAVQFKNKNKYFVINVNKMYNKEVFLMTISSLLGIK